MSTMLHRSRASDPDKSAAWKLFTYRFNCRVKQIHATPDWVFSDYGVISSGNRDIDAQMMDNYMDILLTPMDMALYINRGVDLIVTTPADCVVIYELINQHLTDWVTALKNSPHYTTGPIADLKMFDELATLVWRVAKHFITVEVGTSHLMSKLNSFFINPLGNRGAVAKATEIEEEHTSVTSDIIRLTGRPKRAWESKNNW
jgi:hypothetical protein